MNIATTFKLQLKKNKKLLLIQPKINKYNYNGVYLICKVGVSMFDPTREHDTNPTRVFSG